MLLGSFAAVVAYRVPRGESFVTGRSHCDACGAQIAAYDNVPVLSWLLLRGRCRSCGEHIPARYPLSELTMAALFAATVAVLGTGDLAELALGLIFCATLVTVTLADLDRRVIPNTVLLAAALAAVAIAAGRRSLARSRSGCSRLRERAASCCSPRSPTRAAWGWATSSSPPSWASTWAPRSFPPCWSRSLAGALVGLAMIARHGSGERKRAIPFGPFLALGGVVGLLAGDEILSWYLDNFVG